MFEMQNKVQKLKQQLAKKTVEEFNDEEEVGTNDNVEDHPEIDQNQIFNNKTLQKYPFILLLNNVGQFA